MLSGIFVSCKSRRFKSEASGIFGAKIPQSYWQIQSVLLKKNLVSKHNFSLKLISWQFPINFPKIALEFWGWNHKKISSTDFCLPQRPSWIHCSSPARVGVTLYATGGTQDFIEQLKLPVIPVEDVTDYPSILGGRVKTLHPKIFGGILSRRENARGCHRNGRIPDSGYWFSNRWPLSFWRYTRLRSRWTKYYRK